MCRAGLHRAPARKPRPWVASRWFPAPHPPEPPPLNPRPIPSRLAHYPRPPPTLGLSRAAPREDPALLAIPLAFPAPPEFHPLPPSAYCAPLSPAPGLSPAYRAPRRRQPRPRRRCERAVTSAPLWSVFGTRCHAEAELPVRGRFPAAAQGPCGPERAEPRGVRPALLAGGLR